MVFLSGTTYVPRKDDSPSINLAYISNYKASYYLFFTTNMLLVTLPNFPKNVIDAVFNLHIILKPNLCKDNDFLFLSRKIFSCGLSKLVEFFSR